MVTIHSETRSHHRTVKCMNTCFWVFVMTDVSISPDEFGLCFFCRGENVEEAFLEAAKRIYQNIQDGSLDLNAAESGVQHKPSTLQGGRPNPDNQPAKEGCSC